jgi:hypothetical protein
MKPIHVLRTVSERFIWNHPLIYADVSQEVFFLSTQIQTLPDLTQFQVTTADLHNFQKGKKYGITFLRARQIFPCVNESGVWRQWSKNTTGRQQGAGRLRRGRSDSSALCTGFQLDSHMYTYVYSDYMVAICILNSDLRPTFRNVTIGECL